MSRTLPFHRSPIPSTIKDSLDQDHSVEEQLVECIDHALTPKDKGQPPTLTQTQGQGLERKQGHSEGRGDRVGSDMQAVTNRNSLSGGSGSSSDHDGSSSSLSSPSASGSSSGKLYMHACFHPYIRAYQSIINLSFNQTIDITHY